ncbi:MAG: hypothetical protein E7265_06695 [Lachnospiraceae bacterium]|nr:hypothetical protein [Lachnospiraceae bacterium]
MKKITYICDKCFKELNILHSSCVLCDVTEKGTSLGSNKHEFELCAECRDKVLEFIKTRDIDVHSNSGQKTKDKRNKPEEKKASKYTPVVTPEPPPIPDEVEGDIEISRGNRVVRCGGKYVDLGKLFALKKAGWPDCKIAEEFGLKSKGINNVMRRYGELYVEYIKNGGFPKEEDPVKDEKCPYD